jgi:hypothetical protein
MGAFGVEYIAVHNGSPGFGTPRQRLRLLSGESETNHALVISPSPSDLQAAPVGDGFHFSLGTGSNEPNANSSPDSKAPLGSNVIAASGYVSQIARSSAVIVNQPNVNMYLPGSITRPTCAQVTLFMGKSFSFRLQPELD